MPSLRRILTLLVPLLLLVPPAAQAIPERPADSSPAALARVTGTVLDASSAPIRGAHVIATSQAGAEAGSTVSNERGEFALAVRPGRYTLTAIADGFEPISREVDARLTPAAALQFVLPIARVEESVTVSAPPVEYQAAATTSATKTVTPLRDVPQSVTVVTRRLMQDQLMLSLSDVFRYVPGITAHQGENNRDQVIIRGNNSSADFFIDGVRDDVQYYRDLYNLERVEALKGPNATIFGRGGGGGVINRVTKEPGFSPIEEFTVVAGSFGRKRLTADVGRPLSDRASFRLNAMYEDSDSFRRFVNLERYGINPTFTFRTASQGRFTVGFEHYRDNRVADRGMPSYQGRPVDADASTYFGNPRDSHVNARADALSALFEQRLGRVNVRNRTLIGSYERRYQNFVPGAVSADKSTVALTAYNNDTARVNVFNQTDVTSAVTTGSLRHTLLAGAEVGRQFTDNLRNTGYFNNTTTSLLAPFANPTIDTPVTFRQSATDASNHLRTSVAAAYAQDQVELSRYVQAIAGVRVDRFDLQYHNKRTGQDLGRTDDLVSPRAGIVFKPVLPLSIYGTYTISHLPSSGDQFSSLTSVTEQVKPERFDNYEAGVKWDLTGSLAFTAAAYRLDRTNTRSIDPTDPTRIVQTGSQRTNGFEIGLTGRITRAWQIAGGYANQDAFVTSATTSAKAGAQVAQVPHHTLSLWNSYQVHPRLGLAAGVVHRSAMFAAIDNTVTLPGYTDLDGAVYLSLSDRARLQANVENLFDRRYFINADNNTNISPGSPRAVRLALVVKF